MPSLNLLVSEALLHKSYDIHLHSLPPVLSFQILIHLYDTRVHGIRCLVGFLKQLFLNLEDVRDAAASLKQ